MPDPKNEAFLLREAEREKQRKSNKKSARKNALLAVATIGTSVIAILFLLYTVYCIRSYRQQGGTKTYIFEDSFSRWGVCENSYSNDYQNAKGWNISLFRDAGSFSSQDQKILDVANQFERGFFKISSVTITESPGSFWDPRSEIMSVEYAVHWNKTEADTQYELCCLSYIYDLPEIHTVDEFYNTLHTFQGTDFSEVATNPEYEWFYLYATYDFSYSNESVMYRNYLEEIWKTYCAATSNEEYAEMPISSDTLTAEDIFQLAQAQKSGQSNSIDIDLSQYSHYLE